ncbi:hypothetical protein CR513_13352, partial [Mucuna pruriens]
MRHKVDTTRKLALEVAKGDAIKLYTLLWRYNVDLRRSNLGNTCKIQLVKPSLDVPFIRVDKHHLKTKYGGQLLIVVGRDENDQYFHLVVVVEIYQG